MQPQEQLRERIEQQVERRRQWLALQHEPVRQRVLEVARDQDALLRPAAVGDDADGPDRGQPDLGQRAEQPVLAFASRGGSSLSA